MHAIKNFYIFVALLALMIVRPFAPGAWMGSVAVAGLLVTWLDTMRQVWNSNRKLISKSKKKKYAIMLTTMAALGIVLLVLIVINLIVGIEWLNQSLCTDEITLLSLLICLCQNTIIHFINWVINK